MNRSRVGSGRDGAGVVAGIGASIGWPWLTRLAAAARRNEEDDMTTETRLPDFALETSGGGRFSKADLQGHRTVLYFYPRDDTPGCTLEGQEFTRLLPEFQAHGVDVFGVSADSSKSHDRFIEKCSLGFRLISDPEHVLIDPLSLWVEKHFAGNTYMGIERSTFLIGADGGIEREWRAVKAPGHAAEVLEAVGAG
jgi:peroxiredoxin Q/BCP